VVENLEGNPIARAVRRRQQTAGTPLPTRRHLAWRARRAYERAFARVDYRPFAVLTPALLASAPFCRARVSHDLNLPSRMLYQLARRADATLLRLPAAHRWAWHGLITALR
jgi:hypothetical protein